MSPNQYRVHGLALASEIVFPELAARQGHISPDIRLRRGIVPHTSEAKPTSAAFTFLCKDAVQFDFPRIARVSVEGGRDITVQALPDAEAPRLRTILLGSAMGMLCHQRGMMVLHASAVAFDGQAVAFAGDQGAGKSTLAAFCLSVGARLVADDVLVVSFGADRRAMAQPGVRCLNLWRDVIDRLGKSANGLTRAWPEEEKYHVRFDAEAIDAPVPLARICVLEHDDAAGDGTIAPLKGAAAVKSLIAQTYRAEYLAVVNGRQRHFHDCVKLAGATEITRLARCYDPRRLTATAALVAHAHAAA